MERTDEDIMRDLQALEFQPHWLRVARALGPRNFLEIWRTLDQAVNEEVLPNAE